MFIKLNLWMTDNINTNSNNTLLFYSLLEILGQLHCIDIVNTVQIVLSGVRSCLSMLFIACNGDADSALKIT